MLLKFLRSISVVVLCCMMSLQVFLMIFIVKYCFYCLEFLWLCMLL